MGRGVQVGSVVETTTRPKCPQTWDLIEFRLSRGNVYFQSRPPLLAAKGLTTDTTSSLVGPL